MLRKGFVVMRVGGSKEIESVRFLEKNGKEECCGGNENALYISKDNSDGSK